MSCSRGESNEAGEPATVNDPLAASAKKKTAVKKTRAGKKTAAPRRTRSTGRRSRRWPSRCGRRRRAPDGGTAPAYISLCSRPGGSARMTRLIGPQGRNGTYARARSDSIALTRALAPAPASVT